MHGPGSMGYWLSDIREQGRYGVISLHFMQQGAKLLAPGRSGAGWESGRFIGFMATGRRILRGLQ
ncbi:MAG TPA: hypothetical protein DCS85_08730 [Verrucomicrobiales bacterium]|nr:hypothetical protein [Verrucomicrobiales bacterium]